VRETHPHGLVLRHETLSNNDASTVLQAAKTVGFDTAVVPLPRLSAEQVGLAPAAGDAGLDLLLRGRIDMLDVGDSLVRAHPEAFAVRRAVPVDGVVDPRRPAPATGQAIARLGQEESGRRLLSPLTQRLASLADAGAAGFVLDAPDSAAAPFYRSLIDGLRAAYPELRFVAATPGLPRPAAARIADSGFDHLLSSLGWWDMRARWLAEEYQELHHRAPLIAEVTADAARRAGAPEEHARLLTAAAATGSGLFLPEDFLRRRDSLGGVLDASLSLARSCERYQGEIRVLSAPTAPVTVLARGVTASLRDSEEILILLVNLGGEGEAPIEKPRELLPGVALARLRCLSAECDPLTPLAPGEARVLAGERAKPIVRKVAAGRKAAKEAGERPRLVVEAVSPCVSGGDFAVKRVVGDVVEVEADIYGDGHEHLEAALSWRPLDSRDWRRAPMRLTVNDRWTGSFTLERLGAHEFVVEAWLDRFGGFRDGFAKKRQAGVALPVDFMEGHLLVEQAEGRSSGRLAKALAAQRERYEAAESEDDQADLLLSEELLELMQQADQRPFRHASAPQRIDAERLEARFSSWYELFPRSQSGDVGRHGTFDDVVRRLPQVREMGFDTLYFPPIHPIGTSNRKGPNNTLTPKPGDPGSPYAIGSAEGGHDAIHPELGSFEDFRRLVAAARREGLEIAIDFAIQCAPDHPWLKDHPGWFAWRPDGSMKYAENPPKKYQDIVNVDFYAEDARPGLWEALRDVVLLWADEGVKTFRVDNPHTKPLPFWEWMIGEVRAKHPDAIFLSEAFTRPKVMYRLAKVGFSQSYTYFTWRNTKAELTEYVTELTTSEVKDFFRPHFFVNTPDINPYFLQTSGRPGFQIRAVLAATLSGLFGVYSGFELCEHEPLPGREEYLDSEKYELRPRPWRAPGDIVDDITLLNRLRRGYPALQTHLNTRFYNAWNDQILYYGKQGPDGGDMILVAVSLDPQHPQECDFEVPLWELGLADHEAVVVEDLASGERFQWQGKLQRLRLAPDLPYRIWRIEPKEVGHG